MHELEGKFEPQTFEEKFIKIGMKRVILNHLMTKLKSHISIVIPPPNITGKYTWVMLLMRLCKIF